MDYIKTPSKILVSLASHNILKIRDKTYLEILYNIHLHKKIDFENPKTFNEKLQWLKLNDRNPLYTKLVDKYAVREYIKEKIGEEFLIPLIGVYDKFEDIDFKKLPNKFVIKCTHDSGSTVICKDKKNFDHVLAKKKIKKALKTNYFYQNREWPYKNVRPRIVIEKYMEEKGKKELTDYKLMCFNGNVICTFVCLNRGSKKGLNIDSYDREWNKMPFSRRTFYKFSNNNRKTKKLSINDTNSRKVSSKYSFC